MMLENVANEVQIDVTIPVNENVPKTGHVRKDRRLRGVDPAAATEKEKQIDPDA